jgi:hypothetical protein
VSHVPVNCLFFSAILRSVSAQWFACELILAIRRYRGVVRRRPGTDANGNPVFVLHPDVLDRADVLTMAAGDPAYDELQGQEFEVSLSGEGKVQVADKLLSKSIDYSAI